MTSTVDHRTNDSADEGGDEGESSQQSKRHSCQHCHRSPVAGLAVLAAAHFGVVGSHSGDCENAVSWDGDVVDSGCFVVHWTLALPP